MPTSGPLGLQLQACAHSSISAGVIIQSKFTLKQQSVPSGTEVSAAVQIQPVNPGGTGLSAGVTRSSFTSVAVKPGHSPFTAHGAGCGQLLERMWMYELPAPGHTWSVPLWWRTWPWKPVAVAVHTRSTLPSQWSSGGQPGLVSVESAGASSDPGLCSSAVGGSWLSGMSMNTSKKLLGAIGGTWKLPIGP